MFHISTLPLELKLAASCVFIILTSRTRPLVFHRFAVPIPHKPIVPSRDPVINAVSSIHCTLNTASRCSCAVVLRNVSSGNRYIITQGGSATATANSVREGLVARLRIPSHLENRLDGMLDGVTGSRSNC